DTVNGLLNDGAIDELTEGVRLRRALTTDGTSWQEVRFRYSTPRDDWSWQFAGLQGVSTWQMDSLSGGGGNTGSFGSGSAYQRVDTTVGSSQGWARGFSYGSSARAAPRRARTCGHRPRRPAIRGPSPRCSCGPG